MATLDVFNINNEKVGQVDVADALVNAEVRPYLLNEIVHWQRAKARAGTQSVKTKAEVSGTNKKPFPQKGRGCARQGSLRNPHQVGGGVAFAPKPRDYAYKMPKSKRRAALAVAMSARLSEGSLKVVDSFPFEVPKSKDALSCLKKLEMPKSLMVDTTNDNLKLSVRNVAGVKYLDSKGINVMDILRYPGLLVSKSALKKIEDQMMGAE